MTTTLEDPTASSGGDHPPARSRPVVASPRRTRSARATLEGWGFVAPAMVIVLGLSIFPAAWALLLSTQKWDGFRPPRSIGLDNYQTMISDSDLHAAVAHTILYTVLFVPTSVLLGLFLAVSLNRKIAFIGIYRTAIFVPFVASAAATGILTSYLFNPQFGLLNNVFRVLGLPQFTGIWQVIQAIQLFDLVYTTTRGGPLGATETVVYYLWTAAFRKLQFGYGSAVAYGLFFITLLITIGIVVYSRRAKVEAF